MRRLMWFTLGFTAACIAVTLGWLTLHWAVLTGLTVIAAVTLLLGRKWKQLRPGSALALGCLVGLLWVSCFEQFYLMPAKALDGQNQAVSIQVVSPSREAKFGTSAQGTLGLNGKTYQVRMYLKENLHLHPGDRLTGIFRLRYTGTGGMKESTYHQGRGIYLIASQSGEAAVERKCAHSLQIWAAQLHERMVQSLERAFPSDTAAFAKALLLGDTEDLSYEQDTALQISGIRHVVAVSGFHVSILFSILFLASFANRFVLALVGLPILTIFAALAGFSPSVVRACIMQGLLIVSILFNQEYDPPTALAAAVLTILVLNPMTVLSVSFQLSVSCMIGIFLLSGRLYDWLVTLPGLRCKKKKGFHARCSRFIAGTVSVSLGAGAATMPLAAWHFGTVSLVGILTNLLTLWMVSLVFYGAALTCLLGLFWQGGAWVMAWTVSWGIRYVLGTAKLLSQLPLAAVYPASGYLHLWLLFFYILLGVFLLGKEKRPLLFGCCVTVSLCAALLASWLEPLQDQCRVTVLDVGQGQSVILQSEGKTFLVDCGGSSGKRAADAAARQLLSQGIRKIDGLILTHYDEDHHGGIRDFLSRIDCGTVFLPRTEEYLQTQEEIAAAGKPVRITDQVTKIEYGQTVLTIFPPHLTDRGNESSLCVLFQPQNYDILVTGDRGSFGEQMLLRQTVLPRLEVLVAGHHGSASSTCQALLDATLPETVIISAGAGNPYGHPAGEVLQRLEAMGCQVYRTDLQGTIIYRR